MSSIRVQRMPLSYPLLWYTILQQTETLEVVVEGFEYGEPKERTGNLQFFETKVKIE